MTSDAAVLLRAVREGQALSDVSDVAYNSWLLPWTMSKVLCRNVSGELPINQLVKAIYCSVAFVLTPCSIVIKALIYTAGHRSRMFHQA